MGKTAIEWADYTWNPIRARNRATGKIGWHCEHVSEACRNCYAERMNRFTGTGLAYKPGHRADVEIFLDENILTAPLRWRSFRRIFPCSTTDLFADFVPDAFIDKMFAVMALTPRHTYQILTKRPERMRDYLTELEMEPERKTIKRIAAAAPVPLPKFDAMIIPPQNVWLGVTAEDQPAWDERVEILGRTPAAKRFVSVEPMLSEIACGNAFDAEGDDYKPLDWVICGGESGPHARPMHPGWARSLRDQCAAAGVPFFFKQWGEWLHMPERAHFKESYHEPWRRVESCVGGVRPALMFRIGKRAAGRLLDGVEHSAFPAGG
jgi:protein gp37